MKEKKMVPINKSNYEVKDGKVVITSEELANAIQNEGLDIFIDEEAAAASPILDGRSNCCNNAEMPYSRL
ncbi:hypothetical protein [Wukongibacter sp. M2B1]|uniref:hypothetical protein n=1 Tax=Wukongibacter sp. M2B1 TaxID=3088895 RepID=UPI003D78CA1F